jgi:hypothetical protein
VRLLAGNSMQPNCLGHDGPEKPGWSSSFSRLHRPINCSGLSEPWVAIARFSRWPGRVSRGEWTSRRRLASTGP